MLIKHNKYVDSVWKYVEYSYGVLNVIFLIKETVRLQSV